MIITWGEVEHNPRDLPDKSWHKPTDREISSNNHLFLFDPINVPNPLGKPQEAIYEEQY